MAIRIVVSRDDGQVTELKGESGIAVCMGPMEDSVEEGKLPALSFRCSTPAELAWNLAGILAATKHLDEEAYYVAHSLMKYIQAPIARRLPPRKDK